MDPEFDISTKKIIDKLVQTPDDLAGTFYIEKKKSFFSSEVTNYSPYLLLNNDKLICVLLSKCMGRIVNIKKIFDNKLRTRYEFEEPNVGTLELETVIANNLEILAMNEAYTDLKKLREFQAPMEWCLFQTDNLFSEGIVYLSSDTYTNNLLISIFLGNAYSSLPVQAGMRGVLRILNSTVYNRPEARWGLNLYERTATISEFIQDVKNYYFLESRNTAGFSEPENRRRVFTERFIIDMFTQLLVNLQFLQHNYQLIHGNLYVNNICMRKDPVRIEYSTIRHTSELTFKIRNFEVASMNLRVPNRTIRLFNSNEYARSYFTLFPFKPVIAKDLDEPYYQIEDFINLQVLAKVRHMGIPYYLSFDTISMIVSLMLIPEVYYAVMSNPILKNVIWDSLWHPKDQSDMFNKITAKMLAGVNTFDVVLEVLRGSWIKCKLTDQLVLALSREYLHS